MADAVTSPADILTRQSRPQYQSSWTPNKRDWRYATGVFRHEDLEDDPRSRSAWDWMDFDYQPEGDIRDRRSSPSRSAMGTDSVTDNIAHTPSTPKNRDSKRTADYGKRAKQKHTTKQNSVWSSLSKYRSVGEGSTVDYQLMSLTVRLHFSGHHIVRMQQILINEELATPRSTQSQSSGTPHALKLGFGLNTPATTRTSTSVLSSNTVNSMDSIRPFPRFQRLWTDETRDFNMMTLYTSLRDGGEEVKDYGPKYQWYNDAVSIDAIFPPGVPLSAKEIHAFYPHHVRWKGVMLRLTNNDYRGADIIGMQTFFHGPSSTGVTVGHMNNYQRDTVKGTIPNFKTADYVGRPDHNLYTDELARGRSIDDMCKGLTVPSFDDLTRGLQHLPTGLDARGLTQCLTWYLNIRDTFTPRLSLSVLHTQALIRALRQPLKPFGPQNLDRNALQEWRDKGTFDKTKRLQQQSEDPSTAQAIEPGERTQLHMNLDDQSVSLKHRLSLRHVLTFPFLTLQAIVGEALMLGISKAETRQAERIAEVRKRELEAKWAARLMEQSTTESALESGDTTEAVQTLVEQEAIIQPQIDQPLNLDLMKAYRIPKRPRPIERPEDSNKRPATTPVVASRIPTHPLLTTPSIQPDFYAPPSNVPSSAPCMNQAWNSPASSSATTSRPPLHDAIYARQDYAPRLPSPQSGGRDGRARAYHGSGRNPEGSNGRTGYASGYHR